MFWLIILLGCISTFQINGKIICVSADEKKCPLYGGAAIVEKNSLESILLNLKIYRDEVCTDITILLVDQSYKISRTVEIDSEVTGIDALSLIGDGESRVTLNLEAASLKIDVLKIMSIKNLKIEVLARNESEPFLAGIFFSSKSSEVLLEIHNSTFDLKSVKLPNFILLQGAKILFSKSFFINFRVENFLIVNTSTITIESCYFKLSDFDTFLLMKKESRAIIQDTIFEMINIKKSFVVTGNRNYFHLKASELKVFKFLNESISSMFSIGETNEMNFEDYAFTDFIYDKNGEYSIFSFESENSTVIVKDSFNINITLTFFFVLRDHGLNSKINILNDRLIGSNLRNIYKADSVLTNLYTASEIMIKGSLYFQTKNDVSFIFQKAKFTAENSSFFENSAYKLFRSHASAISMGNLSFSKIFLISSFFIFESNNTLVLKCMKFEELTLFLPIDYGFFDCLSSNLISIENLTLKKFNGSVYYLFLFGSNKNKLNLKDLEVTSSFFEFCNFFYLTNNANFSQLSVSGVSFIDVKSSAFLFNKGTNVILNLSNCFFSASNFKNEFIFATSLQQLIISNSNFMQISFSGESAIIEVNSDTDIRLLNCTFYDLSINHNFNCKLIGGGLLYAQNANNIFISDSLFKNCSIPENGALFYLDSKNHFTSKSLSFINIGDENLNVSGIKIFFQMNGQENSASIINNSFVLINTSDATIFLSNRKNSIIANFTRIGAFLTNLLFAKSIKTIDVNLENVEVEMLLSEFQLLYDYGSELVKLSSINITKVPSLREFSLLKPRESDLSREWDKNECFSTIKPINLIEINNCKNIKIDKMTVIEYSGSAILHIFNCSGVISLQNSVFIKTTSLNQSSLIQIRLARKTLIKNNVFIGNSYFLNGTININLDNNGAIHVEGNLFSNNSAISNLKKNKFPITFSRGGAMYLFSSKKELFIENFTIANNTFVNNTADYGNSVFLDIDCTNKAVFHLFHEAMNIDICDSSSLLTRVCRFKLFELNNASGKNEFENPKNNLFSVIGLDAMDLELLYMDLDADIFINGENEFNLTLVRDNDQIFAKIAELKPGYRITQLDKEEVYQVERNLNITIISGKIDINEIKYVFKRYQCPSGHFLDRKEFYCKPCEKNTMKLRSNVDWYCDACLKDKVRECKGGNETILKEGFWKANSSTQILKCKNKKACNNSTCASNYESTSFLCSRCDPKLNTGITSSWECIDCTNIVSHIFLIVSIIFQILIKAYSVKKAYKLTKNLKKKKDKTLNQMNYTIFNLASTNCCLKIINIHVSFMLSLFSYPFKAIEESISHSTTWINWFDPFKYSFECIFKNVGLEYHGIYTNLFIKISLPFLIIIIWLIYYSFKIFKKRRTVTLNPKKSEIIGTPIAQRASRRRKNMSIGTIKQTNNFLSYLAIEIMENHSLEAILLIALNLSYEDMITSLLQLSFFFNSSEGNKDTLRMLHEPERDWRDQTNQIYRPIAIFLVVFFGVIVPIYIIMRVRLTKSVSTKSKNAAAENNDEEVNKVENYQLFLKYGYFYYPYDKSCYYYEIFYMLKRGVYITYNVFLIPLVSIHTKYEDNLVIFINLEILCMWVFFIVHMLMRPFRKELKSINWLETNSSIILLTSFFLSALFFNNVNSEYEKDKMLINLNLGLYLTIYIVNSLFLVYALLILYRNEKYNIKGFFLHYVVPSLISLRNGFLSCIGRKAGLKKGSKYSRGSGKNYSVRELNPLAMWESTNTKRVGKFSRNAKKQEESYKSFKEKIEILSLIIKFQKIEIKNLKKQLDEKKALKPVMKKVNDPLEEINESFEESIQKIKSLPQGRKAKDNTEPTDSLILRVESMQIDLEGVEGPPNKVELNSAKFFKDSQQAALQTPHSKDLSLSPGRIAEDSKSVNENIDNLITWRMIKGIIGDNFKNYFLKLKVVVNNTIGNLENCNLRIENKEGLFIKLKNGVSFPTIWSMEENIKIILYVKLYKKLVFPLEFSLQLEFQMDKLQTFKKILVSLESSDFLKLEKFAGSIKTKKKIGNYTYFPFSHEIRRKIKKTSNEEKNISYLDSFKYNFPELYSEEDPEGSEFHKSVNRVWSDVRNSIKLNGDIGGQALFFKKTTLDQDEDVFTSRKIKKIGKLQLLLYRAYLIMDIIEKEDCIVFKYRDLYVHEKNNTVIDETEIATLLDKFTTSRYI